MIVRMGYCAGEAGHDLSGEEGLKASLPMRCKYGVLSHKAVHQEQDTGKTTRKRNAGGPLAALPASLDSIRTAPTDETALMLPSPLW